MFEAFPYTNFHDMNMDWILQKMKELLKEWETFETEWRDTLAAHGKDIEQLRKELAELIRDLESGKYLEEYMSIIEKWINDNVVKIIGDTVKYVTFGLTDDGYFCALIPATWEFIQFNTIIGDTNDPLYGHLTLTW